MTTWHILGGGSLGSLWAVRLYRTGLPVKLILRHAERLAQYRKADGILLQEGPTAQRYDVPAETAATGQPIERLLVACKAYDAEDAVATLSSRFTPSTDIILLQNGLGSQDAIVQRFPVQHYYFASTTEGAFRRQDFQTVLAGRGHTWLGSPHASEPPTWLNEIQAAQIPCSWTEHIVERLWRKLAVNCAINPLTVLYRCRNGQLAAHRPEIARLCEDLARLLRVHGMTKAADALFADVMAIIEATADNYSSMQQDVSAGRRTEIRFLLGYACEQGNRLRIPLPHLHSLWERLREELRRHGLPDS